VARQLGIRKDALGRLTTARRLLAKRSRAAVCPVEWIVTAALSQGAAPASVPSPLVA